MLNVLELSDVGVRIDDQPIVEGISFNLSEGQIGCLLGPSGCGKTTVLRAIAGFIAPAVGEIRIDGAVASVAGSALAPERRRVGMVFQDFALFPHLTVRENIMFGLIQMGAAARAVRLGEVAELLEVGDFLDAYPHRLSGGQQQRAAVARAMAPRPRILLLDEPFASLDIELRGQIAKQIRSVLKQDGITVVLVSHNQIEAFAMADEIGVMRSGRLVQWDSAFNIYHRPACANVADFVGEGVFLEGRVIDAASVETELGTICDNGGHGFARDDKVVVLIRPDDIIHDDGSVMRAVVLDKVFRGAEFLYTLGLESGARVLSLVPSHHDHAISELIGIRLEIDHLVVFAVSELRQRG